MPDIFLSYNREDQAIARRFAEAFQAEGFDVWWDTTLRTGEFYDEVTETALKTAKAVVVLWSTRSVESRWVRAEATMADRHKTLLPVMIEACERPIMFELTQTADLSSWDGSSADQTWQAFLADVKRFVAAKALASASAPAAAPPPSARPVPAEPEGPSICVLPFTNMSGDSEQEYFADGITEDIITDLSKVATLRVISRNTAFTFKGRTVDVRQQARQLEVTHVLEGSVRKAGARVRITAQLIDGRLDAHVWADRWDRELDDIFALQDEISEAIVSALKLKLLPEEKQAIEHRATANVETYDNHLRARALFNGAETSADLEAAAAGLRQVIEKDPGFAPARGDLARLYYWMCLYAPEQLDQTVQHLEALARDAQAHSPEHWATHLAHAIAMMHRRHWRAAATAFEKAVALAPISQIEVRLAYAFWLISVGRVADSIPLLEAVRSTDPLSRDVAVLLEGAYWEAGRDADARAEYERTQDLPGNREAQEHTALWLIWDRADDEAKRRQFRRYLKHRTVGMPVQEKVMDLLDKPHEARVLLREALEDPANQDSTRMMFLGWYAALFDDEELAVNALRRAAMGGTPYVLLTFWYPFLGKTRQTSGFKQLVRDLGLDDYWRASGNWGDFARPAGDDDFEFFR